MRHLLLCFLGSTLFFPASISAQIGRAVAHACDENSAEIVARALQMPEGLHLGVVGHYWNRCILVGQETMLELEDAFNPRSGRRWRTPRCPTWRDS
jgi:hypothetical protein